MHALAVKFDVGPTPKLKVNAAVTRFFLANLNDAWYNSGGSKVVLNTKAASRESRLGNRCVRRLCTLEGTVARGRPGHPVQRTGT